MNRMYMMNFTAVLLCLILIFVALTYWRFGELKDVNRIRQELEELRARQAEFIENALRLLAKAYDKSRRRLQMARERLHELKAETVAALENQVKLAQAQLESLAGRLENKAKSTKSETLKAAHSEEESIAVSVNRMEARTKLLQAKARSAAALDEAAGNNFDRAKQLLNEAAESLRAARETLGNDHAYDDSLDIMQATVREAAAAVHIHAENSRQKIEQTLTDADRVVGHLESDEREAAGKS
jgi:DNA repair exonuclease SbcCD ATPase subunit